MKTHTHASEDVHRQIDMLRAAIINGTSEVPALLERMVEYKDLSFRIDKVADTLNHGLYLTVTLGKSSTDSVQLFITIIDPPVLPSNDPIQVIGDMLERFT